MKQLTTLLTLAVVGLTSCATAHPFHQQMTELQWNARTGCWEVAMSLDIAALEDALSLRMQRRVRLEPIEPLQEEIIAYLKETFAVSAPPRLSGRSGSERPPGGAVIRWAGHELQLHSVWLYFEYVPAAPAARETPAAHRSGSPESESFSFVTESPKSAAAAECIVHHRVLFDVRNDTMHAVCLLKNGLLRSAHTRPGCPAAVFESPIRPPSEPPSEPPQTGQLPIGSPHTPQPGTQRF